MPPLKGDAETLRWGIAFGILPVPAAVSWADALVAADRAHDAPSVLDIETVARTMYLMLGAGLTPDDGFEAHAYRASDGLDLVRTRQFGSLEQLSSEVLDSLSAYTEPALDLVPGAA